MSAELGRDICAQHQRVHQISARLSGSVNRCGDQMNSSRLVVHPLVETSGFLRRKREASHKQMQLLQSQFVEVVSTKLSAPSGALLRKVTVSGAV